MAPLYCLLGFSLSLVPQLATAHEFWIEAEQFRMSPSETLFASLRNGEQMQGSEFPFLANDFEQFSLYDQKTIKPVQSRSGDLPAVQEKPESEGLHVLIYESKDRALTYATLAEFHEFAETEDLAWIIEEHKERQQRTENIAEVFRRYSKALIAVGSGSGQDKNFGLELELIAQSNPYQNAAGDAISFQLLYKNKPLVDHRISVFFRDIAGKVSTEFVRTDQKGSAKVDVKRRGDYMLNAVVARMPSAVKMLKTGALWESLWSSSTFSTTLIRR